jgi:hypothetical protein
MFTVSWDTRFSHLEKHIVPPALYRIERTYRQSALQKVGSELGKRLKALNPASGIQPGSTVAVAVASRGTHDLAVIVDEVIAYLKSLGLRLFIFPAMGSHGGGTEAGQKEVIRELLKNCTHRDTPIISSMEVVSLGKIEIDGSPGPEIWFSKDALKADYIVVINRVKPHTLFRSSVESGLCKILAVGCGKQRGAANMHKYDLSRTVIPAAELILRSLPVLFGVSVTETADGKTHSLQVVRPEQFVSSDREQLEIARKLLPGIPTDALDFLLVDEMGKNISGPGMDTNVIGFWRRDGGVREPFYRFLGVRDITDASSGNATGIGMADFTTRRVWEKIDWDSTYLNSLTAGTPRNACCPIITRDDRHMIALVLSLLPRNSVPRIAHIRNTLELDVIHAAEPVAAEMESLPDITVSQEPLAWNFGEDGYIHGFQSYKVFN